MTAPAIVARGVSRRFGQIQALRSFDLTLERGERIALFGPNGAGKTTLLRILGLGLSPDGGSLEIDGLDVRKEAVRARSRIGWLAHQSLLYEDLTARQNLVFWAKMYAVERPEERADALLEEQGLATYADEPMRILSRGMRQRLSLARALVHDPAVLLLDEPFTGLDPVAADALKRRLVERGERSPSLILVTHRIDDGLALTDRWVLLARGAKRAEGRSAEADPAEVLEAYRPRREAG